MKTILRIFALLAVLTLAMLGMTAAWLTWYFDLNDYRAQIAALLSEQTGLRIELKGELDHHVLNGLQISVRDLSVHHADATIADIELLRADISLHDLLDRRLLIHDLEIVARQLRLPSGATGEPNSPQKIDGDQGQPVPQPEEEGRCPYARELPIRDRHV